MRFRRAALAAGSVARSALSIGTALACFLLAVLGVSEFLAGRAAPGILVSAGLESFIAAIFLVSWLADRRAGGHDDRYTMGAPPGTAVGAGS